MTSTVILFLICQISSMILNETKNSQIKAIEANSKTMSPTEKMKCEQKIRISKFFSAFLKYGGLAYLVLSIALEIIGQK